MKTTNRVSISSWSGKNVCEIVPPPKSVPSTLNESDSTKELPQRKLFNENVPPPLRVMITFS